MGLVTLTELQKAELDEEIGKQKGVKQWRRLRAVQMLGEGLRPEVVAEALGCSRASVYSWAKSWRGSGLEGLREGRHPGKQRSLDEAAEKLLTGWLESDPQERGYHATGWTVPMLRSELGGSGYEVSGRTIRRTLKRLKWGWKRPKYVLGRPDPEHDAKKGWW